MTSGRASTCRTGKIEIHVMAKAIETKSFNIFFVGLSQKWLVRFCLTSVRKKNNVFFGGEVNWSGVKELHDTRTSVERHNLLQMIVTREKQGWDSYKQINQPGCLFYPHLDLLKIKLLPLTRARGSGRRRQRMNYSPLLYHSLKSISQTHQKYMQIPRHEINSTSKNGW